MTTWRWASTPWAGWAASRSPPTSRRGCAPSSRRRCARAGGTRRWRSRTACSRCTPPCSADASPGPAKYALSKVRPGFPTELRLPMTEPSAAVEGGGRCGAGPCGAGVKRSGLVGSGPLTPADVQAVHHHPVRQGQGRRREPARALRLFRRGAGSRPGSSWSAPRSRRCAPARARSPRAMPRSRARRCA